MERILFELTGHYAGKSVVLSGKEFRDGYCEVWCQAENAPFVKRSLSHYAAFPVPSLELEEAKKRDYENGLRNQASTAERDRKPAEVQSVHEPSSEVPAPQSSDDGSADAQPETWGAGLLPEGDGHEDPRIPEVTGEIDFRLKEVIQSLDPEEEDHWTAEGLPSIEAVEKAFGNNLTREELNISGQGWNRALARKKNEELAAELAEKPAPKKRGRPKKTEEVAG